MTLTVFLKLVEIQTKIASLFPFLLGALFSRTYFKSFNLVNTLMFFTAMLLFDRTTTAINNLIDYQKAKDNTYKKEVNIIGQQNISEKIVIRIIIIMLSIASLLGLWLVYQTTILLLFMGGACFIIGIFYTFGPVPISRMPLGEILSGLVMGFGIFFITVYVNIESSVLLDLVFQGTTFLLIGNYLAIAKIAFVSLPTVFLIANIMLANNICDLNQDIGNHRYTLPFYIGKKNAVLLFNLLMYVSYVIIILVVAFKLMHPLVLLILVTVIPIKKNLHEFNQEQIKEKTFSVAIKNISIFSGAEVLLLTASLLFVQ
ncbi:1,4-dihydroxy-2-naphthoate octaprenyltransferase [Carnobacterium iners]|uniref:1,4-dihydroxy-2-naphthoate octaprenyltransferase n=1 Tax=Carnobacterium iners TaxID=1073423 RepID=A0A1X7MTD7_9LACT|nr:1,4-dihydroxy-2-naphthoate polyprenyltransferase [Carnobacterium iners]SEL18015.1 1,4-dihydroxy-2-naphthoate octaprenyltransferase [Carnobacterium iners]SMH27608.1 1,4-dihydroxy-2-naphthoate octaprenyltransferase [Carnobacterium iners]